MPRGIPTGGPSKKTIKKYNQVKFQQGHPVTGKTSKMEIGAIKEATPESKLHVILEVVKILKHGTIVESPDAHKYNTRSRT